MCGLDTHTHIGHAESQYVQPIYNRSNNIKEIHSYNSYVHLFVLIFLAAKIRGIHRWAVDTMPQLH